MKWLLVGYMWFAYVLNHADRQVVYTLFPALQREFGYSDTMLGMTGALFLWVYGLCSPAAGIFGDRFPKRYLVAGSIAVWSAFTILSGLSPNGTFLLVCRALLGVSESMFMPAGFALMAAAHGPETRSKAIAIFATGQMVGVATGGSLSGYVAEHLHWRASFFILGSIGILFAFPMWRFLKRLPPDVVGEKASLVGFTSLFKIPSLLVVTGFIAIGTFGMFLVYTWLPTFLYDKFHLGLARAGFEASVYPQIGSAIGLLTGGALADHYYRRNASSRFWIAAAGFLFGAPAIYLIGQSATLDFTRIAAIAFGFCHGFIASNQVPCAYEVVPPQLRATTIGLLNLVGGAVSGLAPYLGGLSRKTIGVDRLMGFTAILMLTAAALIVYGIARHLARDQERVKLSLNASGQAETGGATRSV